MKTPITSRRLIQAHCRTEFLAFAIKSFELLNSPESRPFLMNWHVEAMCHALQEVATGRNDRLIMEVPPRHGKSLFTSVALPAWLLGLDPSMKILVASYGSDLAERHARDTRNLMTSDFYRELFPGTVIAIDRALELTTAAGGGRKAVSVGGAVTGFGADLIIVDDLMKASDANSEAETRRVHEYFSGTLASRLDRPKSGRFIVIQQRLSERDVVGYLREKGTFKVLSLPAIADRHEEIPLGRGRVQIRKPGDLLFPEFQSGDDLERLRIDMGHSAFFAQYLQNPTPPGGNRLRPEWFETYDFEPSRVKFRYIVQSWDTGFSEEPTSDYSVCTTWGLRDRIWHLIHVERDHLAYRDLRKRAHALHRQWKPDKIIVEKAASGHALLDDLRQSGLRSEVRAYQPKISKKERFEVAAAQIEAGRFALPRSAPWLEEFMRECLAFPNARYDDQADSMTQFIDWEKSSLGQAAINRQPCATKASSGSLKQKIHDRYRWERWQEEKRHRED